MFYGYLFDLHLAISFSGSGCRIEALIGYAKEVFLKVIDVVSHPHSVCWSH